MAALLTVDKSTNNPNIYQLIHGKMKYGTPTQCHLALKRNEALIYATKLMNLKNNILSLRGHSQRPPTIGFHLHEKFLISKSSEKTSTLVGT